MLPEGPAYMVEGTADIHSQPGTDARKGCPTAGMGSPAHSLGRRGELSLAVVLLWAFPAEMLGLGSPS